MEREREKEEEEVEEGRREIEDLNMERDDLGEGKTRDREERGRRKGR